MILMAPKSFVSLKSQAFSLLFSKPILKEPKLNRNNQKEKTMNQNTSIISVYALVAFGTAAYGSNLLINGGFETPVITANSYEKLATILGWNTVDVGGQFEIWSGTFGSIPATEGIQQLEINASIADETVFQTVSVTPGLLTTLSFDYTGRYPDNTFTIGISGGWTSSDTLDPVSYYSSHAWETFSEDFTPTTSTLTISFRGIPDPPIDAGAHIDNVSLVQEVPEPSTALLGAVGVVALFFLQIRKTRAA